MGEFSIYHLVFLVAFLFPFIIKPAKTNLMSIVGHFIKWYAFGFAGFIIVLAVGSHIPDKTSEKQYSVPVSQPVQIQHKGVELI
jgi:hypothetical protein